MNNQGKVALVVGATGLVGKKLVAELVADSHFSKVIVLLRKPMNEQNPKIEQRLVDFDNLQAKDLSEAEVVFCCLGTTMAKAGSKEAFYKVDFEYPYQIAQLAKQNKAETFAIITAMGASTKSMFYYSRVKGEIEEVLKQLLFKKL